MKIEPGINIAHHDRTLTPAQDNLKVLLKSDVPLLGSFKRVLEEIPPAKMEVVIAGEDKLAARLNYFFCQCDSVLGARYLNSDALSLKTLNSLFNAHIHNFHKMRAVGGYQNSHRFFMESYWRRLNRGRLRKLFEHLIQGQDENLFNATILLPGLDPEDLRLLSQGQLKILLDSFAVEEGSFHYLIRRKPRIFKTLEKLVDKLGDNQSYIKFLGEQQASPA